MANSAPRLLDEHIEQIALSTTAGLRDALSPSVCAGCLSLFINSLYRINGLDADFDPAMNTALLQHHHEFLNAALRFIVDSSRIKAELPLVNRKIVQRSRDCPHRNRSREHGVCHEAILRMMSEFGALETVLDMLCTVLDTCLQHSQRPAARRFSRRGLWPSSIDDLLPGGAEVTVRALCSWLRVRRLGADILIQTVRSLYDSCTAELCQEPYVLMLVVAMHIQLEFALAEMEGRTVSYRPESNPQVRLDIICPFLQGVLLSGAEATVSTTKSCQPIAGRLLDTLGALLDVVPASERETRNAMCSIGWIMHSLSARPDESVHPSILEIEHTVPLNGYEMLYRSLQRVLQRLTCASTTCGLTERQTGHSMRLCGRCRLYRYCNQECQRQHWRTSHKEVCQGLQGLFEQIHIQFTTTLSEPVFVAACRANDANIARIAKLYGAIAVEDPKASHLGGATDLENIMIRTHAKAASRTT